MPVRQWAKVQEMLWTMKRNETRPQVFSFQQTVRKLTTAPNGFQAEQH